MAKNIYFINAQFNAYIDVHDWDKEKQFAIKENINYLPSLKFDFESDGGKSLQMDGGTQFTCGKVTSEEVGKLIKFNFEGWFKVDCSKRRDKAETWLEPSLKNGLSLLYKGISIYTDINTYFFTPIDQKGKEVDSFDVKCSLIISKPDGINF
jgi:hypothetical protein